MQGEKVWGHLHSKVVQSLPRNTCRSRIINNTLFGNSGAASRERIKGGGGGGGVDGTKKMQQCGGRFKNGKKHGT